MLAMGCGAAPPSTEGSAEGVTMAAVYREGPGPKLARGELCTAVDEDRVRAASKPQTEFKPDDSAIYLVGKLKDVHEHDAVEVRWYLEADKEPQLVTQVEADRNFSFIASYRPTEAKFFSGQYTARVYVNDTEVAVLPFAVLPANPDAQGLSISGLELGLDLKEDYRISKPTTRFNIGTASVQASFDVSGVQFGNVITARWSKGAEIIHQDNLSLTLDKRYTTSLQTAGPMPRGSYVLELDYQGEVLLRQEFAVGDPNKASPTIRRMDLGLGVGKDNRPKKKTSVFRKDASLLFLGVVFADIPPGATMEVSWIQLKKEGNQTHYIARSVLEAGGDGSFAVAWEPSMYLSPGDYKALVVVSGEALGEVPFKVK
jgi:hypothetical protein